MLPLGATVSGCQVLVPFTTQKNRRLLPAPTAAMLTSLPSVVMDGAEKVVFTPATVSGFQADDPFTAQKNRSELFAQWPVMLTLLPSVSIDGWEAAIAADTNPVETVITAAAAAIMKLRIVVLAGRSRADAR